MNIYLNSYALSRKEMLFAALTLTGGVLAKRHWQLSNHAVSTTSKWSHRVVAIIEAIPLLGGLVTLVEIVASKYLLAKPSSNLPKDSTHPLPSLNSPPSPPHLKFNTPTTLTCAETLTLKISNQTLTSELPEYADSSFQLIRQLGAGFIIVRRKKNEPPPLNGIVPALGPLIGPKEKENDKEPLSSEGLKVRTFCLELLSNVEDLQMTRQHLTTLEPLSESMVQELAKLEEIKGLVRYFLEMGALEKKAGFVDFLKLIDILAKGAPEFLPVFQRYLDLVKLQDHLPKKALNHASRWDKIKTMVRCGLFTDNLVKTAAHARKINLHPLPALPKKPTLINLYPTIDAINLLESTYREAGRWIMQHIKTVSFQELCKSIKASCKQLHPTISKWNSYYLLTIKGKSQEWMADIAYRYLPTKNLPKGLLSMGHQSAGEDLFNHITQADSNNFILFDDGAYSCRQLEGYLERFLFELRQHGPLTEEKNIYFIFGHFPKDKYSQTNFDNFKKYNVNIHVISHHLTENIQSLMEKENLPSPLQNQIADLIDTKRPQLMTEWKKPDFMSTSTFISEGFTQNFGRSNAGELTTPLDCFSAKALNGIGPLTEIQAPYKQANS